MAKSVNKNTSASKPRKRTTTTTTTSSTTTTTTKSKADLEQARRDLENSRLIGTIAGIIILLVIAAIIIF